MWLRRLGVILCWCSLVFGITSTRADDTELFIYDFNKAGDFRPKVLLIFDNSGSMRDTMEQVKEAYDPTISYPPLQNDPDQNNSELYIYFATDGDVPSITTSRRFSDKINACASSKTPLANIGYFQSQVWTYEVENGTPPIVAGVSGTPSAVIGRMISSWWIVSRM